MNELYLQDYILKQISRKFRYSYHKDHPADEISLLFGRLTKDSLHKDIPDINNLFTTLRQHYYIFEDDSICSDVDKMPSSEYFDLPEKFIKYKDIIFSTLRLLYFRGTEISPIIFEKTCFLLNEIDKNQLKIIKCTPIKRPDVRTKGNISGISIQYEYGEDFPKLNKYYIFGKYYLENLTKNDILNLFATMHEIEKNKPLLGTKAKIPQKPNKNFTLDAENHKIIRLDCLTYLKRNGVIIDFEIVNDQVAGELIEVESEEYQFGFFNTKLFNTKAGKSLIIKTPPRSTDTDEEIQSEVIFELSYSIDNKILLNKEVLISKPQFGNENDIVFRHLIEHPNQSFTRQQINEATGRKIGKDFHKIVENLKFKGELRRLFFNVSENSILLRNPINKKTIADLKIDCSKFHHNLNSKD